MARRLVRRRVDVSEAALAERLIARAAHAGLAMGRVTAGELAAYVALLLRWNTRMNLTALDGGDRGLDRLVIEPLLAMSEIPEGASTLVDIGSGGGSPAIPIKIARPALFLRMVEARVRKAAFLREAVRRLDLDGTVVETCRYEELCESPESQGAHDVVTVRGVRVDCAEARRLEGLLRVGGALLLFGGAAEGNDSRGSSEGAVGEEGEAARVGARGVVVVRRRCE